MESKMKSTQIKIQEEKSVSNMTTPVSMERILIIGCGGAGKSTLSKQLGDAMNLPVYHLDKLWWKPGWVEESVEHFDAELAKILKRKQWIIDVIVPFPSV